MIFDKLENAQIYANISQRLAKALEILKDKDILEKPDGKYEIDGENIFCLIQRYQTRPPEKGKLEAHKKYIDVQYIVKGREIISHYFAPGGLDIQQPYDEQSDKMFFKPPQKMNPVLLTEGTFGIYFPPHDAHMACLQADGPSDVHKIVVKVKIN